MSNIPSRRAFLAASAAASIASAAPSLGRAADAHAFMLGALEIIVVSDGHLVVPAHGLATNADRKDLELILAASGQPGEWLEPATNVTLIRAGGDLILIDTGAGPHYMPTAGKLLANMAMAGLQPQSITKVIFTHAHPDHIWGTLDELDESPNFPNASYVIAAADNWDKHRLPTIQGVVVVVDARDGRPLAMMDSITLTGLRTRKQGRLSSDELVIFDSTGSGVQDVAAAWAAYGEAARTGAGVRFDFTGEAIS